MVEQAKEGVRPMRLKLKKNFERQKYWDVCNGSCSTCWPKVYQACKSPMKINRILAILMDMEERNEEKEILEYYIKLIFKHGFIEQSN